MLWFALLFMIPKMNFISHECESFVAVVLKPLPLARNIHVHVDPPHAVRWHVCPCFARRYLPESGRRNWIFMLQIFGLKGIKIQIRTHGLSDSWEVTVVCAPVLA